jgi:hypothetical protein
MNSFEPTPPLSGHLKTAIGNDLLSRLGSLGITLMPTTNRVTAEDIHRHSPVLGTKLVCDCYVEAIERGQEHPYGYEKDGIVNIDHHAPTPPMMRPISSGNLAARYVEQRGPAARETPVLINHADCDSVVSSLLIRGHLPVEPTFERAVLAADHFGAEDPIADLLQSLDIRKDLEFSVRNLALLLRGDSLEEEACALLGIRQEERFRAQQVVASGAFENHGRLVVVQTDARISGEFFPPLFPDAALILGVSHHRNSRPDAPVWEMKLRRGLSAPPGFTLFDLQLNSIDPGFGGRWNAGSNGRAGGVLMEPRSYIEQVAAALERVCR